MATASAWAVIEASSTMGDGNSHRESPANSRAALMVSSASPDKGTRCARPFFDRSAGMIQTPSPSSARAAPAASPHYDLYDRVREKRRALEAWAEFCASLIKP
jgi:hypothetical protein